MTFRELERQMRSGEILAVNLQLHGGEFQVHVRHSRREGFTCAQKRHATLAEAIEEHFPSSADLSSLLD